MEITYTLTPKDIRHYSWYAKKRTSGIDVRYANLIAATAFIIIIARRAFTSEAEARIFMDTARRYWEAVKQLPA